MTIFRSVKYLRPKALAHHRRAGRREILESCSFSADRTRVIGSVNRGTNRGEVRCKGRTFLAREEGKAATDEVSAAFGMPIDSLRTWKLGHGERNHSLAEGCPTAMRNSR